MEKLENEMLEKVNTELIEIRDSYRLDESNEVDNSAYQTFMKTLDSYNTIIG